MRTLVLILVWIGCVLVGAAVGYLAGWVLWRLGFELIGSAVALVGAGVGGIVAFLALLNWWDRRRERTAT
jgi:Zn-dependent protease with chaperone function